METKAYLDLSIELQELLQDADIDLVYFIQKEFPKIEVILSPSVSVESTQNSRSKDLVPVILASGIAIAEVIFAISYLINTLQRAPHLVSLDILEEIRDKDGNVVYDAQGNPQMKLTQVPQILDPKAIKSKESFEFYADISKGVVIKFTSEKNSDE
jgi:predicted small secreted protein